MRLVKVKSRYFFVRLTEKGEAAAALLPAVERMLLERMLLAKELAKLRKKKRGAK